MKISNLVSFTREARNNQYVGDLVSMSATWEIIGASPEGKVQIRPHSDLRTRSHVYTVPTAWLYVKGFAHAQIKEREIA